MKTYKLIIDRGEKDFDDEVYTSVRLLRKAIKSLRKDHILDVMLFEGTKEDQFENYRATLDPFTFEALNY